MINSKGQGCWVAPFWCIPETRSSPLTHLARTLGECPNHTQRKRALLSLDLLPQPAIPGQTKWIPLPVVVNVLPAPSHVPFLLSCILVSWESAHTPFPLPAKGKHPAGQAVGNPGLGGYIATVWHRQKLWKLCWLDSLTQACLGLRIQAIFYYFICILLQQGISCIPHMYTIFQLWRRGLFQTAHRSFYFLFPHL